jgi:PAS domain S-box-containing protein
VAADPHRKQTQYQSLIELSPDAIFVHRSGKILYVNQAGLRLFNVATAASLLGKNILDFVHPDDKATAVDRVSTAQEKGAITPLKEFRFVIGNQTVDCEATGGPVVWAGKPAVQVIIRDITDRKRTGEALKPSESRYRTVGDHAYDWEFWLDPQGNFLYCSPSCERITGHSREEFWADPQLHRSIIHPEDRTRFDRHVKEIEAERQVGEGEWRFLLADGTCKWISHVCQPIFDDEGQYQGTRGSNREITERKLMELELKESQQKYQTLVETNLDFIWEVDLQGKYTYCGPQMEKLRGLKPEQMIGKTPFDLMPPEARAQVQEFFRSLATSGRPFQGLEMISYDGYGNLIHLEISGAPFYDENGVVRGYRGVSRDITERKRAEQDLRASLERLEFAQKAAKTGFWDWDIITGTLTWSPEFYELFGISPDQEASFDNWTAVLHPDDRDLAETKINRSIEEKIPLENEYRILLPDGEERWISALGDTHYDAAGKPLRMSGICIDITERKHVQELLQESEAKQKVTEAVEKERKRLFDVLDTVPIMVSLLTSDYHVAFANRSFRAEFGESKGRHCYEYCFGKTEPCEVCESFTVLKTGKPHRWEVTREDGTVIEARDFPFTDIDGSPMILEMDVDVTEQRRAKESIEQLYNYARSLIEASLDPLVTISAEGRITDVNEATIEVTGVAREELIGSDFSQFFTVPEMARKGYQQVFEKGYVTNYPLTLRGKNGRLTDVLYNATLYRDNKGTVQGIFAAARDVTEQKRVERELQGYREHLEELVKERTIELKKYADNLKRSNEDLERFAYISSHDLQEPLRNVVSFSQLLARRNEGKLDASSSEYIGYIIEGGKRMQSLIQDLLEYSRVNTRGQAFQSVPCEDIVDHVLINLQTSIKESDALITVNPLPTVFADTTQLTLVFQNLLGNAIKFRRPEARPQIWISAEKSDHEWTFSITDNGIGIDSQYYDKIFIIFQRLHGRNEYPGTGVGLAIVKRIIDRHGGHIWVESERGKGSTFYFTLPAE